MSRAQCIIKMYAICDSIWNFPPRVFAKEKETDIKHVIREIIKLEILSIFFYCLSYDIYAAHCLQIFDIYKHVKFKTKIPTISHIKRPLFLLSEYRSQLIKKFTKILYYIQQEISRVITLKNWARCSKIFLNGYRMSECHYYSLIQISLLSSEI